MSTLTAESLTEMVTTWRRAIVPTPIGTGKIIESMQMVDGPFEDWSRVRSPGRARRRRPKHRQNISLYYTPKPDLLRLPDGSIVGHPATVRRLTDAISAQVARKHSEIEGNIFRGFMG